MGTQLDRLLAQKEIDHLNWMSQVNRLWTDSQMKAIGVETDDHRCGFGQWLYGQDRRQLEAAHPELAGLIGRMKQPHRELHESVTEINRLMAAHADRESGLAAAGTVLREKTLPALAQVQDLFHAIRKSAGEKIMTNSTLLEKARHTGRNVVISTVVAVAIGLLLAILIAVSISHPIRMSTGDFTQHLDITGKDEIGQLAESLNVLVTHLVRMTRNINNSVATMDTASTELSSISGQMRQGSEQTSDKANMVATAAEEMSANMNSVAAASEQAASNVDIVASATEEMSTTVGEIARNSEKARSITTEAVAQAQDASIKVDELGAAARDINKVTEAITEISEQTNLLALNATIEAARAGEAGKGFAVVANEIKELAKQAAIATNEIKQKINGIQTSTSDTVEKIRMISAVIVEVNEIVTGIAAAVEEQSTATQEIASNVSQASQGIQEVNVNVSQSSVVAGDITKEIAGVDLSAKEMATSSSQVHVSAQDLLKLSSRLTQTIAQFKIPAASFDIGEVKGAHLNWRSRLEGLLHGSGTLTPQEVNSHHECAFGKWYDSPEGQALKQNQAFSAAGHHHEKVHVYARQVVDLFHQGKTEKAAALMKAFEKEREMLFATLDELYLA
ncbi:methyl-accepting chemotaxis protein [Desulfosarcina cetonica]|uniref:methyl-accepting chemotaxis protein n=1 Tax=Desulfosarcina cetonica TaxID=90730 RepID=UPI00155D8F8C|nr:methyl-accepting chemotaxis protein [Desulfosarcina cetonica]